MGTQRDLRWAQAQARGARDRTAWAQQETARILRATALFTSTVAYGFTVSSDHDSPGARVLASLAKTWTQTNRGKAREERWKAAKLLRLARHGLTLKDPGGMGAPAITGTEWNALTKGQQLVVETPRLQTVFEVLGVPAAIENPVHINQDWFGHPVHWWPGTAGPTGKDLEVLVIDGLLALLHDSLGLAAAGKLRDANFAPGRAIGDTWLDTFTIAWNAPDDPGAGGYKDRLRLEWEADPGTLALTLPAPTLDADGSLVLKITTPVPLHPDRQGSPPDLP